VEPARIEWAFTGKGKSYTDVVGGRKTKARGHGALLCELGKKIDRTGGGAKNNFT